MANFETYSPFLQSWEGGYSNNKNDSGGATMCGVTLATWQAYCRSHKLTGTKETLRHMSKEQWADIMKTGYWDAVWGDHIHSQSVACMLADWAVNAGPKRAVKGVQVAFPDIKADGVMGPVTLSRINAANPVVLFAKLRESRLVYYETLAKNSKKQATFLNGWTARVKAIRYGALVCNDKQHTKIEWLEH